jgi:hypothetical protein
MWPSVNEIVYLLNIGDDDSAIEHLERAREAAIERIQFDFGDFDEVAGPTPTMQQAMLRAVSVLRTNAPDDGWRALDNDRIYQSFRKGHRTTFGIA